MRYSLPLLSALSLCVLTACVGTTASGGQPLILARPTDTYTHGPSQFRFPPRIGSFQREAVTQYDQDGLDVSVGYNHPGYRIAATVYVYPVPQRSPDNTLEGHFGSCKAEVVRTNGGAQFVSEGAVQISPGGLQHSGRQAAYTLTAVFAGQRQPLRSELYLFAHGPWFIYYRVTYPVEQRAVAESAAKAFINELRWP
jgi:hypothetical protein